MKYRLTGFEIQANNRVQLGFANTLKDARLMKRQAKSRGVLAISIQSTKTSKLYS